MEAVVGIDRKSKWLTFIFLILFAFSVIHDNSAEAKKRRGGKRKGAAGKVQQKRKRRGKKKKVVVKRRGKRKGRRNNNRFFAQAPLFGNSNNVVPIFNDFNGGAQAFNPFFNQAQFGGFNGNFNNVPVITNSGFGGFGNFGHNRSGNFGGFVPLSNNVACDFRSGQCVQLNQNDLFNGQIVNPNLAETNTQLAVVRQDGQLKMLGAQDVKRGQALRINTLQDMRKINEGEMDFNALGQQSAGSPAGSESNVVSLRRRFE